MAKITPLVKVAFQVGEVHAELGVVNAQMTELDSSENEKIGALRDCVCAT